MGITCPICGADMKLRINAKQPFYGCTDYFITECPGKRDIDGNPWGCDDDEPFYLSEIGSSMFQACIHDGFTFAESAEIASDWERQK